MAQENKIYLIGGSIPEADGDNLYNTCTIWGPNGDLIGKHRKVARRIKLYVSKLNGNTRLSLKYYFTYIRCYIR